MKKPIIILSICMVFSILLVVTLYALSDHQLRQNNSYTRLVLKGPLKYTGMMDLKVNSFYIAGAAGDQVFLGNITAPRMLVANSHLADSQEVVLKFNARDRAKLKLAVPRVAVEPPYFYITEGRVPTLRRGMINEWLADSFMVDNAAYFIDAVPMSPSSFAIRTTSRKTGEFALAKIVPQEPYLKLDSTLLQKQIDGKFCTDGMLLYDPETAKIVYVYYYRNQYIVADTSLNLLYRGNTIDTVTHAQLTTANISSDKAYTMSSPPLFVNKASSASNGLLYIKSPLISKTETEEILKEVDIIDVYDLAEGTYKFSFYITRFGDESLQEFKVFDNKLIVRYSQHLEAYELNSFYFPTKKSADPKNGI